MKCLNTRFLLTTMVYAGYRVKLLFNYKNNILRFLKKYLLRKKGTFIRSLCCPSACLSVCLSVCLLRAFISGTLGDIELKLKPYNQIYDLMIS